MPLSQSDHRDRVGRFVVRVRRVLANPLAEDDEQLRRAHNVNLGVTHDDRTIVTDWLPDEAALESLASRLRPLLLASDPVHYSNAFASMGALLRGQGRHADGHVAQVRALRKEWDKLSDAGRGRYVIIDFGPPNSPTNTQPTQPHDTVTDDMVTDDSVGDPLEGGPESDDSGPVLVRPHWRDRDAAAGWFYGDLVHADPARQNELEGLKLEERVPAAFGFVADVVTLCWQSLGLVWLHRRQLALPDSAWTSQVAIEPGWRRREGEAFFGQADGSVPTSTTVHSDSWEKFAPGNPTFEALQAKFRDAPKSKDV